MKLKWHTNGSLLNVQRSKIRNKEIQAQKKYKMDNPIAFVDTN